MQRRLLFEAILVDDEIDEHILRPGMEQAEFAPRLLCECYELSHDLWRSGFDRAALIGYCAVLIRAGDLNARDRVGFKHMRAKFKHLRYAFDLYADMTRRPPLFDRITIAMGHVQDAYRNRRRAAVLREAMLLRLLLTPPLQMILRKEIDGVTPASPARFRAMIERDRAELVQFVARDRISGGDLHRARKIIGRRVSFYDTLRTLRPTPDAFRMSRALSAINGRMGALHDELVARRARHRADYRNAFVLPELIREQLAELLAVPLVGMSGRPL